MTEIGYIDVSDSKRIILSTGEYKGSERIDLRIYVKTDSGFVPTKQGINFNAEWADIFTELIQKLKYENNSG